MVDGNEGNMCFLFIRDWNLTLVNSEQILAARNKAQTVRKEETLSHHRENNHSFLCVYNWGQPLKDNRRDWSGLVNCLWVCAPCLDSKAEIPCCCPGDESWINRENMTLRLFTLQATVVHGKWKWKLYVELFWRTGKVLLVALLLLSFHLSLYFLMRNTEMLTIC